MPSYRGFFDLRQFLNETIFDAKAAGQIMLHREKGNEARSQVHAPCDTALLASLLACLLACLLD